MSVVRAAVRLRSADPAAVTGLLALRRSMPGQCPEALARYDLWSFEGDGDLESTVSELMSRYTDMLNPNKQERFILPDKGLLPGEDSGLIWVSVEVTDDCSSSSETWTSVVARAGFPVARVTSSVLWRLGYDPSIGPGRALALAREVGVSVSRSMGLLSNPVSQSAAIRLAQEAAPSR